MKKLNPGYIIAVILAATAIFLTSHPAFAQTAAEIDSEVDIAIGHLYRGSPEAKKLSKTSKGILVLQST